MQEKTRTKRKRDFGFTIRLCTSSLLCSGSSSLLSSLETHSNLIGSISKDHQYPSVTTENCKILTLGKSDPRRLRCACKSQPLFSNLSNGRKDSFYQTYSRVNGNRIRQETSTIHKRHYSNNTSIDQVSTQTLPTGCQRLLR